MTLAAGLADPVRDTQSAFRAVLEAMAQPGRVVDVATVPDAPDDLTPAMAALALTLLDGDTPVWLDGRMAVGAVPGFLRFHCGCPVAAAPDEARFALIGDAARMPPLSAFAIGRDQYPEESATLIIEAAEIVSGAGPLTLRGPGVKGQVFADVGGVDPGFWAQWAANTALFPQGVDVVFTCGRTLMCLPRSIQVEV